MYIKKTWQQVKKNTHYYFFFYAHKYQLGLCVKNKNASILVTPEIRRKKNHSIITSLSQGQPQGAQFRFSD